MTTVNFKTWRLIDSGAGTGSQNMATDVALLKNATQPVLRLYTWQPWAISLGYHQNFSDIDQQSCVRDGIDIVRRPTGGRAILHAEELTYCMVFPATHPLQESSVNAVYRQISNALLHGLHLFGAKAIEPVESRSAHKNYDHNVACFSSSVNFEIAAKNRKLIGSAQRRFKEGILQHGSLLIGPAHEKLIDYLAVQPADLPALANQAISLQQVLGFKPQFDDLKKSLTSGFEQYFEIKFTESNLTDQERVQADELTHSFQNGEVLL